MGQYRVSTAVRFDPTFDAGQSFFKSYWAGHLGRAEMNMAIWKARLKMASPDTRRAIEKDLNDRIYKLQKLKTDMITAKQEGNQDLLMKTMELIQKDKASRNTLAGQRVRTAGGLTEQRRERLIQYENSGPTGAEAVLISEFPNKLAGPLSKVDRSLPANALLDSTAMTAAFALVDQSLQGALSGANTPLEVDRVAGDMVQEIARMNTGGGDRGQFIKNALTERLARTLAATTKLRYANGSELVSALTMKYTDRALGLTQGELKSIMGYGASSFDPSGLLGRGGAPTSAASIQSASTSIDTEIDRLRGELTLAKTDTAASKKEFDWLMRGGMGNLALRPVGSKLTPSPLSNYLKDFGKLYQADPEYAEQFLSAQERGEAETPTPYQELVDEPETRYMSGADYLQNSVAELEEMFGPTTPYAPETAKQMARQKLIEMAQAIKPVEEGGTGVLDPSKFTEKVTMTVGGKSVEVDLKIALKKVESVLNDPNKTEDQKQAVTDSALKALSTQYARKEMPLMPPEREATLIGTGLADRIKAAMASKDAGDMASHYGQVTQIYNSAIQKPKSDRGGIEQGVVEAVQQNLLDKNSRSVGLFDSKMQELSKLSEPDSGEVGEPDYYSQDPMKLTYSKEELAAMGYD